MENKKPYKLKFHKTNTEPSFCFCCGAKLIEVGMGFLRCINNKRENIYLPFKDDEGNQYLVLTEVAQQIN